MERAALIPTVYDDPREMIGNVDAVIVATDVGDEHVERCRPFIEAGIPMFILNGHDPEILYTLLDGGHIGTYFSAKKKESEND